MTSVQSITNTSFTSRKSVYENQHTGLKTALGYSPIAAGATLALKQGFGPFTKMVSRSIRNQVSANRDEIAECNNVLNNLENFKTYQEQALFGGKARDIKNERIVANQRLYKTASEMFNARKVLKNTPIAKSMAIALPFIIGSGLIVDYFNNKQRKNPLLNAKTENGNPYNKVDSGKRLGLILGAVSELAMMVLQRKALKSLNTGIANKAATVAAGALGGYILGAISDSMANKKAAQIADLS